MNNIKYISLVIIIVTLFSSCRQKEKSEALIIDLNKTTDVSVFDLFESVKIVGLETTDESMIGTISQIVKHDNKIFILDTKTQSVFCFKIDGSFLYKINKVGRGPDEYTYLESISIDPYNKHLLLLEPFGTLFRYTFNGQFISRKTLPNEIRSYNEVYAINADTLVFQSSNEYQVLYYSAGKDTIIKKVFPEFYSDVLFNSEKTYCYNNSVFFCTIPNNEVVNLSDTSQEIIFKWDFGADNDTKSDIDRAQSYMDEMRSKEIYGKLMDCIGLYFKSYLLGNYENNKYRYASLLSKGKGYDVFIDKATNKQYVFTETNEGLSFLRAYIGNGYFIISSELLEYHYPNEDFLSVVEKIAPEYSDIVKNHNPAVDNPFLILYKLKNE